MFGTCFHRAARWSGSVRQLRRRLLVLELLEDRTMPDATPWASFAHDAQHTGQSSVAAQDLGLVRWQTPVDLSPPGFLGIHYGSPLITPANTVLVPVKTTSNGNFRVEARSGVDGTLKWMQPTDYILPRTGGWTPSYNLTLTPANRLYFPGAGGTVYYTDSPDANRTPTIGHLAFYGIDHYDHSLDSTVLINTPLTSDANGNLYFGFVVTGSNSLNLQSGIARLQPDGTGTWISGSAAVGQTGNYFVSYNSAPALSNDGRTVYVVLPRGSAGGYLVALDSTTLAPRARVVVTGTVDSDSSASPTVGPDGDVYYGVLANNHSRGWLLHFSGDLSQTKTPGAFGWDNTASIVPSTAVPSYHGTSTYLLMSKYNNYKGLGGDGVNKVAILDPNATETDPITGATVMNEVLTIAGITPDPVLPAVREWCINNAAVDPITKSVLVNSEDGYLYRWDLATNTLSQRIRVAWGVGEAYTPTVIGVDGTVYAINNATLWAVKSPAAPAVSDLTFSGTVFGDLNHVRVLFNEPIDSTTFTPAKVVSFVGPSGPGIPVTTVAPVTGAGNRQFDVFFPTQHALGNYVMVIGPDIRDPAGHPMDQNGNGIPGEVPGDQYVLRLTIQGPRIVADGLQSTYFPNQLNSIRLTFNEAIDPTTLTTTTVSLAGPTGRVPILRIDPVSGSNNTRFAVVLSTPVARTGNYTLTIGPDVRDPAGHQMDQNGNFIEGEIPGDQYVTRFAVTGPRITGTSLAVTYQPGQLSTIRVFFSEAMDPATFVPGALLFLGPHGPVPVSAIVPVAGSNNSAFDIQLDPVDATGRYYLWIGPNIRDPFGNAMDQDGNLIPGEIPGDEYMATFAVLGPAVTFLSPSGVAPGPVSSVRLGFNLPMDLATFTPDQLHLTGPDGAIPITGVVPVSGSNNTQFDLMFAPQGAAGLYTLVVGPDIRDLYGNAMDQNGNFIPGEIPGDQYTGSFHIEGARITSSSNYGTLPRGVSSLRVAFSHVMEPETFTPDQVVRFTDPAGNAVTVTDVEPVASSNNMQFDIFFDAAELAGTYTLVIGPNILDVYGTPMDQNGNGIPGEIPGDQFPAMFYVAPPRITGSTPSGTLHGPIADVQVTFDTPMNPDTFTPDSVVSFTGPGGVSIPVTDVSPIPDTNDTQFQISFDSRNDAGQYQMVIGAGIRDIFGDVTTQSYTVQFTLTDATLVLHVGSYTASWNDGSFVITQVQVGQFAMQDLANFDVIWVDSSVGVSQVLRDRAADIAAFVSRGGGLVTEDNGDWSWVPNAEALAFDGQQSGNTVQLTARGMEHPVTAGLTDTGLSNWSNSWYGYFTQTGRMHVLATTNSPDQTVLLVGHFGNGRLVYSAGKPGYFQQYNTGDSRALLRQASRWAAARHKQPGRQGTTQREFPTEPDARFLVADPATRQTVSPLERPGYFGPAGIAGSPAGQPRAIGVDPTEIRAGSPTDPWETVQRKSPQGPADDLFAEDLVFIADFS